jgi:hypothetical protein
VTIPPGYPTPEEIAAAEAAFAAAGNQSESCRASLRHVLTDLLPNMPYADQATQDAAMAEVNAAITQYRAIDLPPFDVVDLANKVSTHLQSNTYARSLTQATQYRASDETFLADPTVTLPQLITQVRALTRQIRMMRDIG